jgi:hypothetical protein
MSHERISQDRNSPSEKLGKLYSGQALNLKIEHSVQPKYFQQAPCCLSNLSRARKPRGGSTLSISIDRARRLPEARPPVALASRLGGQRTGPIFIYTLHRHEVVHRGFEPSVPRLRGSSVQLATRDATDAANRKARNAGRSRQRARRAICSIEISREDRIGRRK